MIIFLFVLLNILFLISTATASDKEDELNCREVYEEFYNKNIPDFSSCAPQPLVTDECLAAELKGKDKIHNIMLLLDSSGSMGARLGDKTKMQTAKDVVLEFIDTVSKNVRVGLIVYGHKGNNKPAGKKESCAGIEQVYPLSEINSEAFQQSIKKLQAKGYTPIAAALEEAGRALSQTSEANQTNWIFLISDGEETCGGNPVEVAETLNQSGNKIIIQVVGLATGKSAKQLKSIALKGGGEYVSTKTKEELKEYFFQRNQQLDSLRAYKRCLAKNKSKTWFHDHKQRFNFFICMKKKHKQTWLGVRKAKVGLLKNKDPRKACLEQIDQLNDAWSDSLLSTIKTQQKELKDKKESTAENFDRLLKKAETEYQELLIK